MVNEAILSRDENGLPYDCSRIQEAAKLVTTHKYRLLQLDLPLDYSQPLGMTTKVGFHVFESIHKNPSKHPLIEFSGGPGANAYATLVNAQFDGTFAKHLDQDVILFDQRGTGGCSDPFVLPLRNSAAENRAHAALFASESIIQDVETFRRKEGIAAWTIAGSSHGSLLTHRYLAMLPAIQAESGANPIVAIHAQVDPATDSWQTRKALKSLWAYRQPKNIDPLMEKIAAVIRSEDCAASVCGNALKDILEAFRAWNSPEELSELEAAFIKGENEGRKVFLRIAELYFAENAPAPKGLDFCDLSAITPSNAADPAAKQWIGMCFSSAVNAFDTIDSEDAEYGSMHCKSLSALRLEGETLTAATKMCGVLEPSAAPLPFPYEGAHKPLDVEGLSQILERFQIPMTLVFGAKDDISPPETYWTELQSYGFDADSIISHCYAEKASPGFWQRGLVRVVQHCDLGHEASFSIE